jgi:hypothetical protein
MFTGIVQGYCPILKVEEEANLRRLAISMGELADGAELGASVAVNGTCLTVTGEEPGGVLTFDVIQETLNLTNLAELSVGILSTWSVRSGLATKWVATSCLVMLQTRLKWLASNWGTTFAPCISVFHHSG